MKLINKAAEQLLRNKICGNDMRHELVLHEMHVHRMNFYILEGSLFQTLFYR